MKNPMTTISKKLRFDIFKRDEFTCQYCGGKPPAVVLEVDHIVPVVEGGKNDDHNLITACFDCNRGKGKHGLDITPVDIKEKLDRIEEKKLQVKAYEKVLAAEKRKKEKSIDDVSLIFSNEFDGWHLTDSARRSIGVFLEKLPKADVIEAMELSCDKMQKDSVFKYFCGICWRKVKEG